MSVTRVLLDILIVLVAAKLAAEASERVGVPPVVGEILAGVLIGPSVFRLVGTDEVLKVFGELGVILLLLDVGLEMDLGELAAVGRAAISVATVGVVVPFATGAAAAVAMGMASKEAIFVGAALTATSVGITARVFGDLRALATVEARTVLGAAVADDVMGLVILTVVTRLVSEGSVSVNSVAVIVLVAVGFLVAASVAGIRFAPWVFHHVNRLSRSGGTLVALGLAFTLAVAELANQAKLAPIVGAFVAGLALSRSPLAPRIRRELTPIGHILIPIFFVQIGLDAQVGQFAKGRVLGIAGVLLAIAVVGKLVSSIGMFGSTGDRLLVGIGMIPRGEVGLIFATLGLSEGIIGRDVYASLLLVVLASTLMTPSLLKWRVQQRSRQISGDVEAVGAAPSGGWLMAGRDQRGVLVGLVQEPPRSTALSVGLDAAAQVADGARADDRLVAWLTGLPDEPLPWDPSTVADLDQLLRRNDARTWRFLLVTGLLDRCLPEIAAALRHRRDDPFETDPSRSLNWPRLERLRDRQESDGSARRLRLAGLVLDTAELSPDVDDAAGLARRVARRLELGPTEETELAAVVGWADLLPAAARRLDGLDDEPVLHLASHLGSATIARDAFAIANVAPLNENERARVSQLGDLVLAALERPDVSGVDSAHIVDRRRAEATALAPSAASRIAATPSPFVLSQTPVDLARQAALAEPPLRKRCVRAIVTPRGPGTWQIDVAVPDEVGLLAHQLALLAEGGYTVIDLATVVWPDKQSLSTFRITGDRRPNEDSLADQIAASIAAPVGPMALDDSPVAFDNAASPWHTVCTVRTNDKSRALLAITRALALSGVNVLAARTPSANDEQLEVLELVDRRGLPLDSRTQERIRTILQTGTAPALLRRRTVS